MKHTGYIAIAAMLVCSACTGAKTNVSESKPVLTATQEIAAIHWEEVTAGSTLVKPNNTFLIMMR